MKRSRAPSSLASTTRAQRRSSNASTLSHSHYNQQEESQQSLEVDVGMEDVTPLTANDSKAAAAAEANVASGKRTGRRRSSPRGSGGVNSRLGGRGGSNGVDVTASSAPAVGAEGSASNGSSTSKSRRGRGGGARKDRKVEEEADAATAAAAPARAAPPEKNGERKKIEACAGGGTGEGGGSVAAARDSNENPPLKKKKKYIRNPETHKEYRTRMEAELAQARKMLEEGNAAMVELARDYKRQQAVIEQYRAQDNSLVSISQLSQLQQSQSQQHEQPQQQQQQADKDCGGVAGAGAATAGAEGFLGCSQDSVDKDPEANSQQLSQDNPLSQTSIFSLSLFGPEEPLTDEPLSQVNQWMAALKDSQEAWSLDDDLLLLPQDAGADGESGNTDATTATDDDLPGPDSVEAMVLAAEALSPSKQGPSSPAHSLASLQLSPAPRAPPAPLISNGVGGPSVMFPGKHASVYDMATRATASAAAAPKVVRVGIACIVSNPNEPGCVLVGKRKGSLGAGTLGLPGGHLEIGEEWATCAKREILEETGLEVKNPLLSWVINSPEMEGGKHYVTIFMLAEVADARKKPRVMELDKCEGWSWEPWESLGSRRFPGVPLFRPLADLKRTSYKPFRAL